MKPKQLIAAGALVGILAVGGASIASAQDSGSTSTPTPSTSPSTPPSQSTAPSYQDKQNCPNMGQSPSSSTPSTNNAPAADATSV